MIPDISDLREFAGQAARVLEQDPEVIGLTVGGSWTDQALDRYSDLDLTLVSQQSLSDNPEKMKAYAGKLGNLINAFTGEHVGEPRLLICLYEPPLLHVDIKFVTEKEFHQRVENPHILFERDGILSRIIRDSEPHWPGPDFQWIEDRFWTWIHYAALKLGRGELLETHDFLAFLRMVALSPLLQIQHQLKPRGVRKVETELPAEQLDNLTATLASYDQDDLYRAVESSITLYRNLRENLFPPHIERRTRAEEVAVNFLVAVQKDA